MAEEGFKRKLTAILSADVAGYSRLMAEDETATVKTIASYREIMSSLIKQHRGRVVDSPGDNLLAEFSSVVDAVQCAVAVQNEIQTRNAELPDNRRMEFRIGVNLGDVIDEEGRIYGDGVNIAARLEAMADPGGICVSKTAFDQIETKLPLGYEYLGEQSVKNIPKPVGAYRVLMKPDAAGKVIGEKRFLGRYSRRTAMAAIIILAIVAGGLVSWNIYLQQSKKVEPAVVEKMAHPLPELPSIAVLPFDNMSGDPQQDHFSDGITEQIIASLSKVPYLFVIARHSTFTYKGKPVKVNQIAEELGVRYVLEGSVQRSNGQVRITVQLIDAIAGHHIWAEKYDRQIKDIFALQDDIAMKIMAEMQVKITSADMGRRSFIKTTNIKAYEKILKGTEHLYRRTEGDILQVRKLAQEAIELDPEYGEAYLLLGWTHLEDIWFYRTKSRKKSLEAATQFAQKAISLSADEAATHRLLASIYMLRKEYEKAIAESQKSVDLAPNSAQANFIVGMVLRNAERYSEAIPFLEKAIRLNPITPVNYLNNLAWAHTYLAQYEIAVPLWNKAIKKNPDYLSAYTGLTAAYQLLGHEEKAKQCAAEVLRIKPKLSVELIGKRIVVKNEEDKKRILEALRKADIPE
jgi:adenylate cyclase